MTCEPAKVEFKSPTKRLEFLRGGGGFENFLVRQVGSKNCGQFLVAGRTSGVGLTLLELLETFAAHLPHLGVDGMG